MKKMNEMKYIIQFFSEWHAGSGLTSGSDLDALVVKDKDGFPFIPGKTLKGLFKEAATEILELLKIDPEQSELITELFGYFDENPVMDSKIHTQGKAFFSNAEVSPELKKAITRNYPGYFYRHTASTAIGENGIAVPHSLRRMQTVIPCQLVGTIYGVDEKFKPDLIKCMKWIKRLGQNRHRGLGRCIIKEMED